MNNSGSEIGPDSDDSVKYQDIIEFIRRMDVGTMPISSYPDLLLIMSYLNQENYLEHKKSSSQINIILEDIINSLQDNSQGGPNSIQIGNTLGLVREYLLMNIDILSRISTLNASSEVSSAPKAPAQLNQDDNRIDARYVVVDFETTGFSPDQGCRIIEIAAVEVLNGFIGNIFTTLLNPQTEIPDKITELTGISNFMVSSAPYSESEIPKLIDFIGNDMLVAHNISFEMRFLSHECRALGINPPLNTICTLQMAKKLYPFLKSYKLENLLTHLQISASGPLHRAMPDAEATARALIAMLKEGKSIP